MRLFSAGQVTMLMTFKLRAMTIFRNFDYFSVLEQNNVLRRNSSFGSPCTYQCEERNLNDSEAFKINVSLLDLLHDTVQ